MTVLPFAAFLYLLFVLYHMIIAQIELAFRIVYDICNSLIFTITFYISLCDFDGSVKDY